MDDTDDQPTIKDRWTKQERHFLETASADDILGYITKLWVEGKLDSRSVRSVCKSQLFSHPDSCTESDPEGLLQWFRTSLRWDNFVTAAAFVGGLQQAQQTNALRRRFIDSANGILPLERTAGGQPDALRSGMKQSGRPPPFSGEHELQSLMEEWSQGEVDRANFYARLYDIKRAKRQSWTDETTAIEKVLAIMSSALAITHQASALALADSYCSRNDVSSPAEKISVARSLYTELIEHERGQHR